MTSLLTNNLIVILALMLLLWLLSLRWRDASIVDPFWGTGLLLLAWITFVSSGTDGPRTWLLLAMVTLWGLRLSLHLLRRNWGHGEDARYAAMRDQHGRSFWWVSLLTVFTLQGVIMWVVALPLQWSLASPHPSTLGWLDLAGLMLWSVGMAFETIGDWQLARFKADPAHRGRVLDRGLWRYTRHPNYFGDFCVWWGIYLVAVSAGAWWTIISPLLMSFLLIRVSGVRLLESTISQRRPEYRDYALRTNAFFPAPPRDRRR